MIRKEILSEVHIILPLLILKHFYEKHLILTLL